MFAARKKSTSLQPTGHPSVRVQPGFTLIELLVVIAIIGLLVSILLPALSRARSQVKTTLCLARLRSLGQGIILYASDNKDTLVPGRLPAINDDHWRSKIEGGLKYRPTFLALLGSQLQLRAFDDPQRSRLTNDKFGQPGDRQNYASEAYVCPEVPDWVDERNGSFGYNYQFLGNARLWRETDPTSYKNWPVKSTQVRSPAECVAVADGIGTAASFPRSDRKPYEDNEPGDARSGRSKNALGNEGFNLDPPAVDPEHGEMAGLEPGGQSLRTALHERHGRAGNVLWLDGHGSAETLTTLGYNVESSGVVNFNGKNRRFSHDRTDEPWRESNERP